MMKQSNKQKRNQNSTYKVWGGMIQRCTNPKHIRFKYYGGRGIQVCKRWRSFENFLADMGERPSPKHTIDRFPDGDGNYEPGNCRWATQQEQQRNRSNNQNITFNGKTQCIVAWAEETGIDRRTISKRLKNGWSVEKALTTPTRNRSLTFDGRTQSLSAWANETGISSKTLSARLASGWSVEKALTTPTRFGRYNHNSRYTWDEVCEIRRLAKEGWSDAQLAQKFGGSRGGIWKITNYLTWPESA